MHISRINSNLDNQIRKNKAGNPFISGKNESDSFTSTKADKSNDGKFTIDEALKNFGKGIISPLTAVIKHPVITGATIAAAGLACYFVPVLGPVMGIGFGALSLVQLGKGCYNAAKEYKQGNYDSSEKAFEQIGQGFISTTLSVLGLKQNAKIAAEAKAMNKMNVTTLDVEQKAQIAQNITNGSKLNALKEILSLFTTKEGRQACLHQLKPQTLQTRFIELRNLLTGKLVETKRKVTYEKPIDKIKKFKESPEGQRRAALSEEQIQSEVETLFDKAFDELGIPKEQRPELKISEGAETSGGSYDQSLHMLKYNPRAYKAGVFEMDDVIMHEATHCKEALLRAGLPQDKVDVIVKNNLTNRIINGESEEIIMEGNFWGPKMMTPPKMPAAMKKDFAKFANECIYKKDSSFYSALSEYCSQKAYFAKNSSRADMDSLLKAEQTIRPLLDKLQALMDRYPDFASQYNNADEALTALSKYSLSHHNRYIAFTDVSIPNTNGHGYVSVNLTPEEMVKAQQSLIDSITTIEGNGRIAGFNGLFANQKDFNQYQFSPEEVLAQQNGNKFLIKNLSAKLAEMKQAGTLSPEDEVFMQGLIKKANLIIEYKTKGLEYYQKYTELLSNPNNKDLVKTVSHLEEELKALNALVNPKEAEIITEFITVVTNQDLITNSVPANITALISEFKNVRTNFHDKLKA